MNTHELFLNFNSKIELADSKRAKLKKNRNALRDRVRKHFETKGWAKPRFHSQGSFVLNTNLNPIRKRTDSGDCLEEYDLDDGVYFICSEEERKQPSTYHTRLKNAVDGHATDVQDKTTCVRVIYADGHHIDLPSYWLEKEGDVPQLAHLSKGYIESDPKAFKEWVEEHFSASGNAEQLRRMIRYLKAWKNYRESENARVKIPSGFVLTILACEHFCPNDRDDVAFEQTLSAIKFALNEDFCCYRPTVPTHEDLLEEFSKEKLMSELNKLMNQVYNALNGVNQEDAATYWREVFGDRFPKGDSETKTAGDRSNNPMRVKVSRPWRSY